MALNWLLMPEEALMFQTASPLILKLSLFLMTAVATHLVMSLGQTLLHYKVATIQLAVSCFTTTSTSITPIMPTIILSLGDTSVTKATLRRTSLFLYSSRGVRLFPITAKLFCGDGNRRRGLVLRACLFRQGISRRRIAASQVCVVQTPAGTALCSSPSRE